MTETRKGLDLSKLSLAPATPQRQGPSAPSAPAAGTPHPGRAGQGAWPSRESQREIQLNIRAPEGVVERFKEIVYRERLNHSKTLELLIELYETSDVKESR